MSEWIIKLRLLWRFYRSDLRTWKTDVWDKDGRERMCCNGYMCGCQGADNQSWWEYLLKEKRA